MRNLTLLSPINARPSKFVSISQILCSEINQKSTYDNVGRDASIVNQPIPLLLNDNTSASDRNGCQCQIQKFWKCRACWGSVVSGSQGSGGLVANVQT